MYGWRCGNWKIADTLARSKKTDIEQLIFRGFIVQENETLRLLKWSEYSISNSNKNKVTVWEIFYRLQFTFKMSGLEVAASILREVEIKEESVYQLLNKFFVICSRLGRKHEMNVCEDLIKIWK